MAVKWKSSTVLVAGAFAVSVVLLFAKAEMMRERATEGRPVITNHLYSPAAADARLRDRRAAERLVAPSRAVVVREPVRAPVRRRTQTPRARGITATRNVPAAPSAPPAPTVIAEPYHVITGTFGQRANAERALAQLKKRGYRKAFIGLFDEGTKHCTIAGKFEDEAHARIMVSELATKWSQDAYIYEKTE